MNVTSKVLIRSMIVNASLSIIKIVSGFLGHSTVLIADGIHSFSDLATDIMGIIGGKIASKPADNNHPYGHGRLEYLTSIIIGLIILYLGIKLIISAFVSHNATPTNIVFYVSIITIVIKYLLAKYIMKNGYEHNNNILISSGQESMADTYSSIIVIISFFGSKLIKYNDLFKYSESIGTIIVGGFILYTAYNILKDNIVKILGQVNDDTKYIEIINNLAKNYEAIKEIKDINMMQYGSYYKLSMDALFDKNIKLKVAGEVVCNFKKAISQNIKEIKYIKIMIKPYGGK